jgi:predicted deacylase
MVVAALSSAAPAAAQDLPRQCGPVEGTPGRVFWHYNCIEAEFERIVGQHPEIAQYYTIGESVNGNPIFVLEIANRERQANETNRPGFYLDATHHGNEIQSTEAAIRVAQRLVAEYGSDANVTRWVDEFNIYINPVVNPDGNIANQRANANQVDLNRNYPFEWGVRASNYGPGPASEPEVKANVDFMMSKDLDAYVSMHTGTWDYVSPRCSKDNFRERAKTDDEVLYEHVYAELIGVSGMGVRGASGTGESICWAYDVIEVWSILPEVSEEQGAPFTVQETEQLEGAMRGLYWMLDHTGRFGALLEARLAANESAPSGLVVEITNHGLKPTQNWTFEMSRPDANAVFLGNTLLERGATKRVNVPKQFLGHDVTSVLEYDHLDVDPLRSDPENGTPSDPVVKWFNFTEGEAQQVLIEAGGEPPASEAARAVGAWAVVAAVACAIIVALRRPRV